MQLHYHVALGRNFGDDLNEWIWDALTPDLASRGAQTDVMVGLGSILHANRLTPYTSQIAIMGPGYNGGALMDAQMRERCRFYAVRGPLTHKKLGLDESVAMLDPGALVADLQKAANQPHQRPLFIPHRANTLDDAKRYPLKDIADQAGLELLSPAEDSHDVLDRISGASLVVTESLHGAIVADAYRVPWVPLVFGPLFTPYKWHDWAQSLDMQIDFEPMLSGWNTLAKIERKANKMLGRNGDILDWRRHFDRIGGMMSGQMIKQLRRAAQSKPYLSDDAIFETRKQQFYAAADQFKRDFH